MLISASDSLTFLDYLSRAGVVVLLLVILYGGFRRWWVFGWVLKESEDRCLEVAKDRNEWKEIALRGTGLAERLIEKQKD